MEDLEPESEEASGDGAAWMATFADMMTLLLCFFILLLSFATMDVVKFREALGSVQEALGVQSSMKGSLKPSRRHRSSSMSSRQMVLWARTARYWMN